MNFNATLIGQMITFGLLVLFTMKYVWPPIIKAMEERQARIADGLAAAERGVKEQELAAARVAGELKAAKQQANEIIGLANKRALELVEQSKTDARDEGQRQLATAQSEIEQEMNRAKQELRGQVASVAIAGASKVLGREIDEKAHAKLIDELIEQI